METFVGFFIMFAICTGIFGYATLKDGSDQGRKEFRTWLIIAGVFLSLALFYVIISLGVKNVNS